MKVRFLRVISVVTRRRLQHGGCTDTRYETYEVGDKGVILTRRALSTPDLLFHYFFSSSTHSNSNLANR